MPSHRSFVSELGLALASKSRTRAFSTINQHAEDTRDLLRSLHEFRNEYSPSIRILHPQSLSLILVEAVAPPKGWDFGIASWRDHIALTLVCRAWCSVALHTPSFWSSLPISTSLEFPKTLARSKDTPMIVRTSGRIAQDTDRERYFEAFQAMLEPERLNEFHVEAYYHGKRALPKDNPGRVYTTCERVEGRL
ncbi:hypothetical protein BDV98DRAFT_371325 [Pterulicium gracile]|uniref:Uncharacterized protein n=1 Tax=Pterulicium gracile TaxID=1884261 RepID=A0A5C3Q0Y9_9AGAR|nr:hypothetical protein BDV98DRAFT_371325 [Pterula gracilis]